MEKGLLIKTFGRNAVVGPIREVIINEDNVESIEYCEVSKTVKIWMTSGSFYVDLRFSFDSWKNDVFKRIV